MYKKGQINIFEFVLELSLECDINNDIHPVDIGIPEDRHTV